ncbi:MAG: hypothetical protein SFX73_19995 [Kofleriaceae bacterium]|nr:hypothetical protein [Kofleriaceae bacterium]
MRLGLGDLLAAGARGVSRYTGTLFSVFLAQSLLAGACMLGIAFVLAQAFSHLPMFDDAVDGDLVALIWCLRHARPSFLAVGGVIFSTLLLWQLMSWFLVGGIYGVFGERPDNRVDTARVFGASGAATFLAYARLAFCALPGWVFVLAVFTATLSAMEPRLQYALSVGDVVVPLAVILVPSCLVLLFFWTVSDYARVELTLRYATHRPSAVVTYFRALVFVFKRPLTLVHGAIGWLLFLLVTLAYAFIAHGHPMYGAEGAITLFFVRQGVALLRMAIRFSVLAGQIELGRTRPLPTARPESAKPTAE